MSLSTLLSSPRSSPRQATIDDFTTVLQQCAVDENSSPITEGKTFTHLAKNNVANSVGDTVLHLASKIANIDVVTWAIENGANPCLTNSRGEYPLHCVIKYKKNHPDSLGIAQLLLNDMTSKEVDHKDNDGYNALTLAGDFVQLYLWILPKASIDEETKKKLTEAKKDHSRATEEMLKELNKAGDELEEKVMTTSEKLVEKTTKYKETKGQLESITESLHKDTKVLIHTQSHSQRVKKEKRQSQQLLASKEEAVAEEKAKLFALEKELVELKVKNQQIRDEKAALEKEFATLQEQTHLLQLAISAEQEEKPVLEKETPGSHASKKKSKKKIWRLSAPLPISGRFDLHTMPPS